MYPIVIFAFNRPESLKRTIESLKSNPEAIHSDLFLFVDGFRENKPEDNENIIKVRNICSSVSGFKSVTCKFSKINKGLGPSIISGVDEIINLYGKVIVLEDDLIVQPNFLKFMNECLERYERDTDVWSICGYSNKIKIPLWYKYDAYFCPRSSSWGWATWKDRWNSVVWTFDKWEEWKKQRKEFNKWGGSDCFSMLERCKQGKNKSWAIRFCFNQFLQNKLSLFPIKSFITNDGFDGAGTNCKKYSRFKYELMDGEKQYFNLPSKIEIITKFRKQMLKYNSIPIRIWSRFMYMLYR